MKYYKGSLWGGQQTDHLGLFTLTTGYDEVCKRLYENASSYTQNEYWFEQNVIGIDYNYDDNCDEYEYVVFVEDVYGKDIQKVYTNKVISTMAPLQLKYYLPYMIPIDTQETRELTESVLPAPCYKINFIYDSSFWIDYELKEFSIWGATDMEIYGVYIEDVWTNGTLTAIQMYTMGDALWDKLQAIGDPYDNDPDIIMAAEDEGNVLIASKILVEEMVKQLRIFMNVKQIPYPLAAFASPFGYNISNNDAIYHWKAGSIPNQVINNIQKPVYDEDIYLVSSSYSKYQGWQYGAIWAAIKNLRSNFGMKDIDHLSDGTCMD